MRLLVIEDDRDAADYIVRAFGEVGHVADRATDGRRVADRVKMGKNFAAARLSRVALDVGLKVPLDLHANP